MSIHRETDLIASVGRRGGVTQFLCFDRFNTAALSWSFGRGPSLPKSRQTVRSALRLIRGTPICSPQSLGSQVGRGSLPSNRTERRVSCSMSAGCPHSVGDQVSRWRRVFDAPTSGLFHTIRRFEVKRGLDLVQTCRSYLMMQCATLNRRMRQTRLLGEGRYGIVQGGGPCLARSQLRWND